MVPIALVAMVPNKSAVVHAPRRTRPFIRYPLLEASLRATWVPACRGEVCER